MRRFPFLACAVAASLVFGLARPAGSQTKDELVIGMTQFPSTLHPNIDSMAAKSYVLEMAQRPFTTFDKDWKLVCMLCVTLPTIENGLAKLVELPPDPDAKGPVKGTGVCELTTPRNTPAPRKGIELTYTIHPRATWGDGTPVTTDDVLFTWEVGRNEKSGVANLELYRRIAKIEVKDRKTFIMTFDKLTFDYNGINDFRLLPAHIERAKFADPAEYKRRTAFDSEPANPGLYFGPYRITEVATGSHIVLEANPTWYGAKPAFKRIVVRVIDNTTALEANLLSGSIDYVAGELGFQFDQALSLQKRQAAKFDFIFKPGLVYEHIDLNLDNPILKDKRIRQGLLYAIDREELTKQLFEGYQPVAHSFVSPLDWIAAEDTPRYPFDKAKAAALFAAAGFSTLRDGVRVNVAGERLSFELMTTAGNRTRELVEQVLQSQWKQLGVDVRIRNEPARVFFGETMTQRKFTAMAMFAWISSPENVPRGMLRSDEIPTVANNFSGENFTGYNNPLADELIDCIEVELDKDKRREMWRRLQFLYADDLPVLPLYYRADPFVIPKWLAGIEPTGHQDQTPLWIENWKVRP